MERVSQQVYETLLDEVEGYRSLFAQMERDYDRQIQGETLCFAVDYSELHPLIYYTQADADRVEINRYIYETLEDPLTLLPAAVGELLAQLQTQVPLDSKGDLVQILQENEAVRRFQQAFAAGIEDHDRLMELYAEAESEFKRTLRALADIILRGDVHSSVRTLKHLLRDVLEPIHGVDLIAPLPRRSKASARLVRAYLDLERPGQPDSNRADALNYAVALSYNRMLGEETKQYMAIYSDSKHFVGACKSSLQLQVKGDYLVRDVNYLHTRTRLQETVKSPEECQAVAVKSGRLCRQLGIELRRYLETVTSASTAPDPRLELLDLIRRFEQECEEPFAFREDPGKRIETSEDAQRLRSLLEDEGELELSLDDALSVLKQDLRVIHATLGTFTPVATDGVDARTYKTRLCVWLGFEESGAERERPDDVEEDD